MVSVKSILVASALGTVILVLNIFPRAIAEHSTEGSHPLAKYEEVLCPSSAFTIAAFGQSNNANYTAPKFKGPLPVNLLQFDWKGSRCYRYREPLLGVDGTDGHPITPAAVELARRSLDPVLVVPFARGSSTAYDWAYGYLSAQLALVTANLKERGIEPDLFLWHQGEKDNEPPREQTLADIPYFHAPAPDYFRIFNAQEYERSLEKIVSTVFSSFPQAHFGIALVSRCESVPLNEELRAVQRKVAMSGPKTFISVDSDAVWGEGMRVDGCHFSQRGAAALGEQYVSSIAKRFGL